jgi:hypothetical protein
MDWSYVFVKVPRINSDLFPETAQIELCNRDACAFLETGIGLLNIIQASKN